MSTAVDTAFEELMSSATAEPEALHTTCGLCFPGFGPGSLALCGHANVRGRIPNPNGWHHCAECLTLEVKHPLPCGH